MQWHDDEAISQEGSQVDAQEEPELQEPQLPHVGKCQKEELSDRAAAGNQLPPGPEGLSKRQKTVTSLKRLL